MYLHKVCGPSTDAHFVAPRGIAQHAVIAESTQLETTKPDLVGFP
jgi:hypothetical protein